jgi:hypothetical protein
MMIRRLACLAGLIWILWSIPAQASCSGSGTTWTCPAGASASDIQNAINGASNNATITFAAGTYSFGGTEVQVSTSKGVTLICATAPLAGGAATTNPCTITGTNTLFGLASFTGVLPNLYRISGFQIQSSNSYVLWFDTTYPGGAGTMQQLRIDHNTFSNMQEGSWAIFLGDVTSTGGYYYGVADHNTVNNATEVALLGWIGNVPVSPPPSTLGTGNNFFLENNTISITQNLDASDGGCTDAWGGASVVARYNTSTNCLWTSHGATHGGGPENYEFYNNSVTLNSGMSGAQDEDCYRCFHDQGSGTVLAFNNVFTPYSGHNNEVISVGDYRSYAWSGSPGSGTYSVDGGVQACDGTIANQTYGGITFSDGNRQPTSTWFGYPCWHQAGRDFAGNYTPMYAWNNTWSDIGGAIGVVIPNFGGTPPPSCAVQPGGTCDYVSPHVTANRDYYNAVSANAQTSPTSPFNGTTGMGFGTLANQPTTCTTNSTESGAGVGYFATDQGAQGTLYTCSATNTWTVYYTPYTYPHPLVGGDPPPAPPTGLQAQIQ